MIPVERLWQLVTAALAMLCVAGGPQRALASACRIAAQGDGTVTEVMDARTLRLHDGRELRLTGIEVLQPEGTALAEAALRSLVIGRMVTLHGTSDTPDRYGRQPALVFADDSGTSVQAALLAAGVVANAANTRDAGCALELSAAESRARRGKSGIWAGSAIKNAESQGDILARVGQFTLVEGKVLSVRQAGTITYINFERRWTQDFTVIISRRALPLVESSGMPVKSLEGKTVLVRGWVKARGGPRIEVFDAGQIAFGDR